MSDTLDIFTMLFQKLRRSDRYVLNYCKEFSTCLTVIFIAIHITGNSYVQVLNNGYLAVDDVPSHVRSLKRRCKFYGAQMQVLDKDASPVGHSLYL